MISTDQKEFTVRFLLGELKKAPAGYPYSITMPNEVREHELIYRMAIELLKSEPPPPYTPPPSGFGMRVVVYHSNEETREMKTANELYPLFGDTLWQLCLRGLLRPGTGIPHSQYGQAVDVYTLTLRGGEWIKSYTEEDVKSLVAVL